jgi:hypothetical protein
MANVGTTDPVEQMTAIYTLYAALFANESDSTTGLGGKLLYTGEIDQQSRRLLIAANIAGAASLAASPDPQALRQAMRDGVIDFLVNSLEEALRILKNEIRKHQTVAVGVSANPKDLVASMLHRGVQPDLLPFNSGEAIFLSQGAKQIEKWSETPQEGKRFVTWSVDRQPARWLPRLDECAKAILPSRDGFRQRWLRLAPRYLGKLAQRQHGIVMDELEGKNFRAAVEKLKEKKAGEPEDTVQITISN